MRDLRRYWREVRELERNLPAFVWLMTIEDQRRGQSGGLIVEAQAAQAAKLLHAGSHRLATPEEIAEYLATQAAKQRQDFHENLRRKGITVIPLPDPERVAEAPPARRRVR